MSAGGAVSPSSHLMAAKTSSYFLRRDETPTGEAHELESTAETKIPTETELEEFFAGAEKNLQKEFVDKYNYDTVKDEPLEGRRYEWVPIQPNH